MLLNYHKYMIITTEIIKSKKPLLIVQDRDIKFIVQRFLIQSLAACMTVGRISLSLSAAFRSFSLYALAASLPFII